MDKRVVFLWVFFAISHLYAGPGPGFIENKNQWPCEVDFLAQVPGGQMALGAGQFNYFFFDYEKINELHEATHERFKEVNIAGAEDLFINGHRVSVNFVNSNTSARPKAAKKSSVYYNYFLGANPDMWASNVHAYGEVTYEGIYEGIDLKLYIAGNNIKYDLIVAPGIDPDQIQIQYDGAMSMMVHDGDLIVDAKLTEVVEKKPIAFQWIGGKKVFVAAAYHLAGNRVSFSFTEGYDPCYELVIDPLLIFSTYSGFTADNWGSTATPGEHGNLYSAGVTNQTTFGGNFPAFNSQSSAGPFQVSYGGLYDVAIFKYDSLGQEMLYASFLGGAESESPHSLIMNKDEELLVLGTTSSANFPTTAGVVDRDFNGGGAPLLHVVQYNNGSDIFVAKISKDGSQLLASTYLGGSDLDGLNPNNSPLVANYGDQLRGDIITDQNGDVLISTVTSSSNFPVQNSFSTAYKGGLTDAVVLKLSGDLSQIIWGAYVGGAGTDASHTVKFDSQGKILVGGGTSSVNFPVTAGSYQPSHRGHVDGWIAKLEPDGSGIIAGTFTGTSSFDQVYFLDLNASDEVYVYGQTSGQFPVTPGVYNNPGSGQFLQKLGSDLNNLSFSTVFGSGLGIPNISPTAFLVNECNNIYMTGWGGLVNQSNSIYWNSNTVGMPVTPDAFQSTSSGSDFYFMVLTDDATQFLYGTYMGGNLSRTHVDGGTSRFDKGGIVYHAVCSGCAAFNANQNTSSSDFPTTPNSWSGVNNSLNCNNAAFKFDLSSLNARIVTNSIKLDQPGLNRICLPDKLVFQNKSTGGEIYEWDFGDGTFDSKPDTVSIIHEYQSAGTYQVGLRAIDQGTCKGEDFDFATIVVSKASGFAEADKAVCFESPTQLLAGGGAQYKWYVKKDSVISELARPTIIPKDTTSYFVDIVDSNGCLVKDTVKVSVVPGIDFKFDFRKVGDCYSRPTLLLVNRTVADEDQHFEFGDGSSSEALEVTHNYKGDGNYRIKLVGKKEFCTYEKSVDLPFFAIKVPNVITPGNAHVNSVGRNDVFRIIYGEEGIRSTTDAGVKVSLSIYNRWGKLVYKNLNYDDSWDGEGLEAGTYYYEAEIENEPTCKGWIQIIR